MTDEWEGLPIVWAPCEIPGYEQSQLVLEDGEDDDES